MLELFNAALSTCSQKVRLVLAEKGLAFEDRQVNFASSEHLSDWYLALNPNGVVPTLRHGTRIVADSSVINEYLDEVFSTFPLVPTDPYERAKMRVWRQYIDEVPTVAVRIPSYNAFVTAIWAEQTDEQWEAHKARLPLRKHFYQRMSRTGFAGKDVAEATEDLKQTIARMDLSLAAHPWIAGDAFTLADISLLPTIVRMEDLGLATLWVDVPRVADWYERCQSRPSFDQAYYAGSRKLMSTC